MLTLRQDHHILNSIQDMETAKALEATAQLIGERKRTDPGMAEVIPLHHFQPRSKDGE
jgi:hypothetical protein